MAAKKKSVRTQVSKKLLDSLQEKKSASNDKAKATITKARARRKATKR